MLKALVINRFEIKTHTQERPEVAVDPKMTKADPKERTQCKEGPGPDGKDPRTTHAILNMLVSCQNVTMEQAAELFPTFAAWYVRYPIVEKTGLKGGWDFTLSWSSGNFMQNFSRQVQRPIRKVKLRQIRMGRCYFVTP